MFLDKLYLILNASPAVMALTGLFKFKIPMSNSSIYKGFLQIKCKNKLNKLRVLAGREKY